MKNKPRLLSMILLAISFMCQPLAFAGPGGQMSYMAGNNLRNMPDLRVRSVRMGDPTVGNFDVLIQNVGKAKASYCQLRLLIKDQSGKTTVLIEVNQPPLEAGGHVTVKVPAEKSLGAYWKYEITTDSSSKIAESNESNNTWVGNTGKV